MTTQQVADELFIPVYSRGDHPTREGGEATDDSFAITLQRLLTPKLAVGGETTWIMRRRSDFFDAGPPLALPPYAELPGLPPLLILVGAWEVLLDDSTRFAERAKVAGVDVEIEVWEEMIHGWPFFAPFVPEAREAIDRMGNYIGRFAK